MSDENLTFYVQPRDENVTIRKKKNQKRPREKKEFSVNTLERETKQFIADCRSGKISPTLHKWDKDTYIASHPQRPILAWLKNDPASFYEVEFKRDGKDTGVMTGKSALYLCAI